MRLLKVLSIISLFAAVTAATATAGRIVASATGGVHFTYKGELRTFSFAARKDSNGTTTGQAQLNNRAQNAVLHMTINCLKVSGSTAIMSGVLDRSTTGDPPGTPIWFKVIDNGHGARAPACKVSLVYLSDPPACNKDHTVPLISVEGGTVQVRSK